MKRYILSVLAVSAMCNAVPAAAQQGINDPINDPNATRIGCYRQMIVPAKYSVKKIKIKDSYRQYIKRTNGRIDLMEYPAVYREERTMVAPAEKVMRQIPCPD